MPVWLWLVGVVVVWLVLGLALVAVARCWCPGEFDNVDEPLMVFLWPFAGSIMAFVLLFDFVERLVRNVLGERKP